MIAINDEIEAVAERYAGDDREFVIDMLADLMLFCAVREVDFCECIKISLDHFEAEIAGRLKKEIK